MPENTHYKSKQPSPLRAWFCCIITLLLLLPACNKDSENGPRPRERHFDLKNECQSIGPSTRSTGFILDIIGIRYDRPMFNPNDPDELLYHERGSDFSRLIKYRISTGEKQLFLEGVPRVLELDWGRGGWIAFSGYADMFLIREDGSDLQTVPLTTEGHSCAEPDFNPDGTVVGFPFGGVDGIGLYGMYLLYNIPLNKIDTIDYGGILNNSVPLAWSPTNKMSLWVVSPDRDDVIGLGMVDMDNQQETVIFKLSDRKWDTRVGEGMDIQWNSNGRMIYQTGTGLLGYPIDEYKEIRIKKSCESRYYQDIAISPDDRHIVVERVDVRRQGPFSNTLEQQHRLFIMDIDGCNERLLFEE